MSRLDIALRTWTRPAEARKGSSRAVRIRPPDMALVFDTETTADALQTLNFGSYRVLDLLAFRSYSPFWAVSE